MNLTVEARPEGFASYFEDHYPLVVAYARRRGSVDPEGVAAQVFTAAWSKRDTAMQRGLPWLYRAAFLEIQNERRSQARSSTDSEASEKLQMASGTDDVVEQIWIRSLLSQLSELDREILRLVYWEDLDLRAAATVLGCSTSTARVRVHRARRRLQNLLEQSRLDASAPSSSLSINDGSSRNDD